MQLHLAIDDKLLKEAQTVGKQKTKKACITQALEEYIRRRKQLEILDLFDKIEYDDDYKGCEISFNFLRI